MRRLASRIFSFVGYALVIPYAILEPVLKIPGLAVMPDEPTYWTHVGAALFAVVAHGLIVHLLFRGIKRSIPFGISLLVATFANMILRALSIMYVLVSL